MISINPQQFKNFNPYDDYVEAAQEEDPVIFKLLKHQKALLDDTNTKIIGLIAGFGAGKTFSVAMKAIQLLTLNPGCDGIILEPTYSLITEILIPEINKQLEAAGYPYKYNKGEGIYYVEVDGQTTRIITKSIENYEKLIGVSAAWVIADEFDVTKREVALAAFNKLLGRIRSGNVRQFIIVTTPEGYKAAYTIFVEEQKGRLIKAKTTDNPFLPDDFIQTLYDNYPPHLIDAYINGEFVNMTSGSVFPYFNRETHNKKPPKPLDSMTEVWLGGDFNAGGCVTLIAYRDYAHSQTNPTDKDKLYVMHEIVAQDTFETRDKIIEYLANKHIYGCFDASGSHASSNASQSDLDLLADAGVQLAMGRRNPHLNDAILSVNNSLLNEQLYVDIENCPGLAKALEQLAYDPRTGKPEKLVGPATIDDYCFAAITKVWYAPDTNTPLKQIYFKDLPPTGYTMSPDHTHLPYTNGGYKHTTETITLNKTLQCTPDHKFYTIEEGWVEAKDLLNLTVCTKAHPTKSRNSIIATQADYKITSVINTNTVDTYCLTTEIGCFALPTTHNDQNIIVSNCDALKYLTYVVFPVTKIDYALYSGVTSTSRSDIESNKTQTKDPVKPDI